MELFTPDFGLIFWMFVAFGVLFLVLWKFAWPVILKTVDSRAELIDKGVEYAQNARRQQADMLRDADKMKTQIIEQAKNAAQTEAQKVMDNARIQIQQQQKEAQQQFRNQVSEFALEVAGQLVHRQLSGDKAQENLVDNILDDLERKN